MTKNQTRERASSAMTLSDMEVFIFPELIYSLVLANIMSPRIWRWREDEWFGGLPRMKPYRRITRLKQYIMDHYVFNLDLDTWGLTTKERELARFRDFVSEETLAQSNALFGYEGDRYYFDIDIRRHFGLDKYGGEVIPYWKTETVEAMDAFCYRPSYGTGAGECVSLSTLYAAALFLVAGIPLEDLYLMATPLHSQNFVDVDDGILTNNRRLVTKTMWFNGSALSAQARRALENERVTVVAHASGVMHTLYEETTMPRAAYEHFTGRLRDFLSTPLTGELLGNFLRQHRDLQRFFQLRFRHHGMDHYAAMERLFHYEHGSPYRLTDNTRDKLMDEVDSEELMHDPIEGRIVFNDVETYVQENSLDLHDPADAVALSQHFCHNCLDAKEVFERLLRFCSVEPRLPDAERKTFLDGQAPLGLDGEMEREEIIERLESIRDRNAMADLAFYAYRDLTRVEPEPYLAAAVQRNPVCIEGADGLDTAALLARVIAMADASIYDGAGRLALPDEVWNYARGDGLEKAVLLADILRARRPRDPMDIVIDGKTAVLQTGGDEYRFETLKGLAEQTWSVPPASRS